MRKSFFSTIRCLQHENPLGLPRAGAPPRFPARSRGLPEKRRIRDVSKVIAVSSAKGGVGKSTIAVNLALAFSRRGLRTGILDADIFGPSIPTILNLSGEPRLSTNNQLLPLQNYGLKTMSMGYLLPSEKAPVAWRGLMVMKAIQQLLYEVEWGGLDMLVLDMPPGTGDIQLTIGQQLVLDGAVIVTTPQDVALKDAVKGVEMFKKMSIPILGMVQNMSVFVCPKCGEETNIFPAGATGGVHQKCVEMGIEVLGNVPLDAQICEDADRGKPTIVAEEGSNTSVRGRYFFDIADRVSAALGR